MNESLVAEEFIADGQDFAMTPFLAPGLATNASRAAAQGEPVKNLSM
jgi:hypothetical protein